MIFYCDVIEEFESIIDKFEYTNLENKFVWYVEKYSHLGLHKSKIGEFFFYEFIKCSFQSTLLVDHIIKCFVINNQAYRNE